MNSKKQTIWLVSMLSLMVVLSAYYLFTEDVKELDVATSATGLNTREIVVNTGQLDSAGPVAPEAQAVSGKAAAGSANGQTTTPPAAAPSSSDAKAGGQTDGKASSTKTDTPSSAGTSGAKADDKAAQPVSKPEAAGSTEDAKVLQTMQTTAKATSGSDYFISLQLKRNEELAKQVEGLMAIATDLKKTKEEAAKAQEEIARLQDMHDKVTSLEEGLMKDFPQVVVTQDAAKWKVTVQANKLERSQALSIVDKAMAELGLNPDQIKVEMKP
ncbi:stage III sporulation protein AH [Paenibacillus sp. UNCCL117]|uniref:SpoIIIAH-like family protein n=1 Tax=unclassified Paenibacillus TaxID=185978 RepID=UPI000880028E|nr:MULTISPECIES: SpoIIIAH-like family protein [unclassified Paenibacillus]SDD44107.1 stage III sporulation protein AH [Paenibacillus sp. cl123]SFW47207.1 stage III sporulation protein AH [Paenibacillus sp. UNCCL117]